MASDDLGSRLIFLISQPRSGSTLLQRLLSAHPWIASLPEPWLMLPLLYALRPRGVSAEYNARNAYLGLTNFVAALPDGRATYNAAVRAAAMTMYGAALQSSGKRLFLDKTPRYYLVIPELMEVFPEATFLFLVRNPVDVFSSHIERYARDDWTRLTRPDRLHDLVTAPFAIKDGLTASGDKNLLVRYEDLVTDTRNTLESICRRLEVAFDTSMLQYTAPTEGRGALGDSWTVAKHDRAVVDYVDAWRDRLDTSAKRQLALQYLRHLGRTTVDAFGYDYATLETELATGKGLGGQRRWDLISKPPNERSWRDSLRLATAHAMLGRRSFSALARALSMLWIKRGTKSPPPNTGSGGLDS